MGSCLRCFFGTWVPKHTKIGVFRPVELVNRTGDLHNSDCRLTHFETTKANSGSIMAKSKKKKETTFLVCQETGDINYVLLRKPGAEKLQLKKYSPRLRRVTLHTEKRK